MAFSDWEISQNGSGPFEAGPCFQVNASDIGAYALGSGSARYGGLLMSRSQEGTLSAWGHVTARLASGYSPGFVKGRVRASLFQLAYNTQGIYGLLCMMSAADISAAGADGYGAWFRSTEANNGSAGQLEIVKWTNGLSDTTSFSVLASLAYDPGIVGDYSDPNMWAMELMWLYDVSLFGGTQLIFKVGPNGLPNLQNDVPGNDDGRDFDQLGDLAILSVTDSSSPLSTSVGEGMIVGNVNTVAANRGLNCIFDDVSIYDLT